MKGAAKKLLLSLGSLLVWTGCASIGPPEPPSLELPKPPTDLRAVRKGDKVALTWTVPNRTTERQSLRYLGQTDICRSVASALTKCESTIGESSPPADFEKLRTAPATRLAATFADALPPRLLRENAAEFANYAVEVRNPAGRAAGLSNQVRVPLLPTLPAFSNFAVKAVDQGVQISWRCPAAVSGRAGIRYFFRIYRRADASSNWIKVADVDATDCANSANGEAKAVTSFVDDTLAWENTYFYRGAVISVAEVPGKPPVEVEGDDTEELKIFAHDIFPPPVPANLQAVFSGTGHQPFIDLIWAPVTAADLDGYNIYRHEAGGVATKVNSEPVKAPGFRDANVEPGKTYFYSVSAIDERGNESGRSDETSETVP